MWAEKPGKRGLQVPGSTCSQGVNNTLPLCPQRLPVAQQASSSSFTVGRPPFTSVLLVSNVLCKKKSKGPDGFCFLLSSVALPNSHFAAAAQLQGSQGCQVFGSGAHPLPTPHTLKRSELMMRGDGGEESLRLHWAVVPGGQVLVWWLHPHPISPSLPLLPPSRLSVYSLFNI